MGMTELEPGSNSNTMPSHTHERRMEIYTYFELPEGQVVKLRCGEPTQTRHIVMYNEDASLTALLSIHSWVGTSNYSRSYLHIGARTWSLTRWTTSRPPTCAVLSFGALYQGKLGTGLFSKRLRTRKENLNMDLSAFDLEGKVAPHQSAVPTASASPSQGMALCGATVRS